MDTYILTIGHYDRHGKPLETVNGVPFYRALGNLDRAIREYGKVWTHAVKANGLYEPEDGEAYTEDCSVYVIETNKTGALELLLMRWCEDTNQDSAFKARLTDPRFVKP